MRDSLLFLATQRTSALCLCLFWTRTPAPLPLPGVGLGSQAARGFPFFHGSRPFYSYSSDGSSPFLPEADGFCISFFKCDGFSPVPMGGRTWGPSLSPGSAQLSLLLLGPVWVSSFLSMANEGCPSWRGLCPAVSTTPAAVQGGREPRRTKLAFLPGFLEPYPLGREHCLSDARGPGALPSGQGALSL